MCLAPIVPCTCRFHPSCSHYGIEALSTRGFVRGTALIAWRLLRCNPFSRGGFDPVPPPRQQLSPDPSP
ncbi:MAG: membrane protein insertion efficiency factor YidD [Planctomycetes bacterium]|nr:membrane protein insertion efficiency factor YidD [Planctomycetota bacterium]